MAGAIEVASLAGVARYTGTGDGVTDDTAAIQAALDAAAISGGIVLLPPGTYLCSTLVIGSKVTLCGSGVATTTIKLKSGTNADLLTSVGFADLTGTITTNGISHFTICDLTLDGNKAGNTSGWTFRVYGYCYRVNNVEFVNGASGGAWSEWGVGGNDMEAYWSNFKIREFRSGCGLYWSGPHDSIFVNGVVQTLDSLITSGGTTAYGVYLKGSNLGGGGAAGELFTNVHVWGRVHYGFYPFAANQTFYSNCVAEGAFRANLLLTSGSAWSGGTIYGNNVSGECGIQIGDATYHCTYATVNGVFMNNFTAGGSGVNVLNTAGRNTLRINAVSGTCDPFVTGSPFLGVLGDFMEILVQDSVAKSWSNQPMFTHFEGGLCTMVKAGTPVDADFPEGVASGAIVVDTTASKIWVRVGSTWKSVTVS